MVNGYKVLGVDADAAPAEIRRAYIDLMKRCHPDALGSGHAGEEQARKVNHAFWTLRDPARRAAHDRILLGRSDERLTAHGFAGMRMPSAPAKPPRHQPAKPARRRLGLMIGATAFLSLGAFAYAQPQRVETLFQTPSTAITPASAEPSSQGDRDATEVEAWQIHSAVADMRQMLLESGRGAVESYSRRCFAELTAQPTDSLLDHCLAFDAAAALVEEPAGERSRTPAPSFEPTVRVRRQREAALLVTGDTLSAEARRSAIERETVSAMANYEELPVF